MDQKGDPHTQSLDVDIKDKDSWASREQTAERGINGPNF